MGHALDLVGSAARARPSRAVVLPGASVGVFDTVTDGSGYRFVPPEPVLLYSLSPGSVRTECAVGPRRRFAGARPNAAYNLIPGGEAYRARTGQPRPEPLRFASVAFRLADLSALMRPGEDTAFDARPALVVEDRRVDRLVRLLAEGADGGGPPEEPDDALVRGHVLLALGALVLGPAPAAERRSAAAVLGALDARRLARVRDHVEGHLEAGPVPLSDLARVAGLSAWHFARAFRAATGVPPAAYVRARRLERARALLRATDLPVAEVARLVGYGDAEAFGGRFRRDAGLTPLAYRRRVAARAR